MSFAYRLRSAIDRGLRQTGFGHLPPFAAHPDGRLNVISAPDYGHSLPFVPAALSAVVNVHEPDGRGCQRTSIFRSFRN